MNLNKIHIVYFNIKYSTNPNQLKVMKVCTVSTNGHTLFYKMQKASFSVNVLCVLVYLTLLVRRHQTVHLVGFREVQLGPVWNLLKLWTLIEGATHSCLPGSGVVRNPIRQIGRASCRERV